MGIQHQFILDLLSDGRWHCSNEIPYRDYRRRVQDLIDGVNVEHRRFPITKELCRGRCGRNHGAGVNWLRLAIEEMPQDDKRPVHEKTPVLEASVRSQPIPERQSPPAQNYQAPPKKPNWKQSPDFHRPIHKCCNIAVFCYAKNLPVRHSVGCAQNS